MHVLPVVLTFHGARHLEARASYMKAYITLNTRQVLENFLIINSEMRGSWIKVGSLTNAFARRI